MPPKTVASPINQQTPITIGLFILVMGVSAGAIFKAGQVLTEFDQVKSAVSEIRAELRDIKSLVRQSDPGKRSDNGNHDLKHDASMPWESSGSTWGLASSSK